MWKEYSKSYLKNNRASSMSIIAAAFIATLFLSFLCCIGYNFWTYEIEQIALNEGTWQGRIIGNLTKKDLTRIKNFSNVENAVISEKSSEEETIIDIYFQNKRTIYKDMPTIAQQLGLEEDQIQYHSLLLSRYFIHDPSDKQPPLLLALYVVILMMASLSLILIIRNSFEISMNARIHQFGIFSSIGATPRQIRICLIQEAATLSFLPILAGSLIGIIFSYGTIKLINLFAADAAGRHEAVFSYHFGVFAITILLSAFTVLFSVWIPARKLSKMTPLQAIHGTKNIHLKKQKHSPILSLFFGIEGELSGNALRMQKKALRISTISLLLSFLSFSIMLCFTTLSSISTRYTYFERYQNAWDIMITVKDTKVSDFKFMKNLKNIADTKSVTVYQKAKSTTLLAQTEQSDALLALGGFEEIAAKPTENETLQVNTPIIILDDDSFLEYCSKIGAAPSLEGTIILNRIWDNKNSNFRYKKYIPFIKEQPTATLQDTISIPVVSYTQKVPVLREEYDNYSLVHFIPMSLWISIADQFKDIEKDSYIRILSNKNASLKNLNDLENNAVHMLSQKYNIESYNIESENRLQEKLSNDRMIRGTQIIFGAFCALLGIIGIANVFSNTLGFLRQRKREFAQYMSIGLTPSSMKKMFFIEGLVIAGKPLIITLPLTVVFVQFAVTASYLEPMVFWSEAPIIPILIFAAAIVVFVALAYYIGGKRILKCNLNETLRNDTL